MDPAGWLLWSLGLSYVDLCSQLAWEDTHVSLQPELLPATGWKPECSNGLCISEKEGP